LAVRWALIRLGLSGTYTFAITDASGLSIPSFSVTIAPAAPAKLVIVPPSGAVMGTAASASVSVEDAYGNITSADETDSITLTLVSHPTGSTLSGGGPVTIKNGLASFGSLVFSTKGNYTIEATMTGPITPLLAAATSSTFAVAV